MIAHDAQRAVWEKVLVDGETRVQRLEAEVSVMLLQGLQSWMCEAYNDGGRTRTSEAGRSKTIPLRADVRRSTLHGRNSTHATSHRGRGAVVDGPELRVKERVAVWGDVNDCPQRVVHCRTTGRTITVVLHGCSYQRGRCEEEVRRSQSIVSFHGGKPCSVRRGEHGPCNGQRQGRSLFGGSVVCEWVKRPRASDAALRD